MIEKCPMCNSKLIADEGDNGIGVMQLEPLHCEFCDWIDYNGIDIISVVFYQIKYFFKK
jgi:hypothetical protein